MITLAMDTAYKSLTVALFDEDRLLASYSAPCFKHQSEELFPRLEQILKEAGADWKDIGAVVITDGPGSYTGVRIAMTVAKVLCSQFHLPLYTVSTLQLYGGNRPSANVLLDARSHRAYVGHTEYGRLTEPEIILEEGQWEAFLASHPGVLVGDPLAGPVEPVDFVQNFMDLRAHWRPVENVHALVPRYLKESEAYRR